MTTNEKQMLKNNKLMLKMDREREERRTHIHHYKSSWEGNVCCICNKPKIKFYSDIKPKNTFAKKIFCYRKTIKIYDKRGIYKRI